MDLLIPDNNIIIPPSLSAGDKIALISPATIVKEEYVYGAMERIKERGYLPVLMPHALGPHDGSFASQKNDRLSDLYDALRDPEIKAILCTRGGYGCAQLLAYVPYGMIFSNPKWIIGFSDISALLAMWFTSDMASIHGPMAKHLATMPADDPATLALFNLLENGGCFEYTVSPHPYNYEGEASGVLIGGNLAVLNDLASSPYDVLDITEEKYPDGVILFLEDINEPIYKVNRMLWRLYLSGCLSSVKGIIFGHFTDYKPDANYESMEDMIHDFIENNLPFMDFPVAFNFPTGHVDYNLPLTVGAKVRLTVTDSEVNLRSEATPR